MNAKKLMRLLYAAIKKHGEDLEFKIKTEDEMVGTIYLPISSTDIRIERVKTKSKRGKDVEDLVFVVKLS